jgi:hypothetical protein
MTGRSLRLLERHARLVTWLAVLGWLAYIAGAIASGRRFRPGWLFNAARGRRARQPSLFSPCRRGSDDPGAALSSPDLA